MQPNTMHYKQFKERIKIGFLESHVFFVLFFVQSFMVAMFCGQVYIMDNELTLLLKRLCWRGFLNHVHY